MLLQDDDGPLLLAALLELGDVGLVLPPLPVGADHDLGLPQLDQSEGLARSRDTASRPITAHLAPALPRPPAAVDLLDDGDELLHAVPPPLLQLDQSEVSTVQVLTNNSSPGPAQTPNG